MKREEGFFIYVFFANSNGKPVDIKVKPGEQITPGTVLMEFSEGTILEFDLYERIIEGNKRNYVRASLSINQNELFELKNNKNE